MGQRANNLLLAAALAALVLVAYIPAMRGGFFWDDDLTLTKNPLVIAGDGLRRIWMTREAADYFPLTSSMMWVEWRLWDGHPAGFHVVNILLHAAAAVLVWRILRRLNVPGAWLGGALFGVHPVAVLSAAWITEGKNTLSMLLCLLALLAWLTYDENEKRRWHVAALALFLLALLAKTLVVMMPAVLLLCAWWRRGAVTRKDVARSLPFFALSLALGMVTVWFQSHNAIGGATVRPEGMGSRIAAAGWMVWFYLWKALLPTGLCVLYPRWTVDGRSVMAYLPLALLFAGLTVLWANRARWGRAPLFALGYFLIMLLPALGLADMSFMYLSLVSDHFQYLALAAVAAFAAAALARAAAIRELRTAAVVAGAVCVAAFAALTWQRAALFTDGVRLWQDNVAKQPGVSWAWNNMGNIHMGAGRNEDALRCFNQALAAKPDYDDARGNRGMAFFHLKRYPEAILDFDTVIQRNGPAATACNYRGMARAAVGRTAEAISDFDQAIKMSPNYTEAYNNRGNAHAELKHSAEALADYSKVIELDPNDAVGYINRANAFVAANRSQEAFRDYDRAVALAPNNPQAFHDRARARAQFGLLDEALADYNKAIELAPSKAEGLNDRAGVYVQLKRLDDALRDYDSAIAADPNLALAYVNRAAVRLYMGQNAGALADITLYQKMGGKPDAGLLDAITKAAGRGHN